MAAKKGAGDKKDLNELKQELDIDDHKIPIEELYQRLGTNPETVSFVAQMSIHEHREKERIYQMEAHTHLFSLSTIRFHSHHE